MPSDVVNYAYTQATTRLAKSADLERAAVERVARASGEPRHDAGGGAALCAGCDELDDGCNRRVLVRRGRASTARSRASPRPSAPPGTAPRERLPSRRRSPRTASSARDRPRPTGRDRPPRGSRGLPAAASAIRMRPSDAATRAAPARAPPAPSRRAGRSRRTDTARLRGRSQRAPSRRPTARAERSPGHLRRVAATMSLAPGSLTPGRPASETSAILSPASSRGTRSTSRVASLCWW